MQYNSAASHNLAFDPHRTGPISITGTKNCRYKKNSPRIIIIIYLLPEIYRLYHRLTRYTGNIPEVVCDKAGVITNHRGYSPVYLSKPVV